MGVFVCVKCGCSFCLECFSEYAGGCLVFSTCTTPDVKYFGVAVWHPCGVRV